MILALTVFTFLFSQVSSADTLRAEHPWGVLFGIGTAPFPSQFGFNLGYNLQDHLTVGIGYGSINGKSTDYDYDYSLQIYSAEAKLMIIRWQCTPYLVGGASKILGKLSGTGWPGGFRLTTNGLSYVGGVGLDWQTKSGLTFGAEYKYLMQEDGNTLVMPGFYFGVHF